MVFTTVSSINRANPKLSSDSDFVVQTNQNYARAVEVRVNQIVMPNSMYNVTDTNNGFYFTVADDVDGTNGVDYNFTLPEGYYNILTLISALQSAIDAEITPLTSTVSLISLTSVVSIQISGGKYIRVNFSSGGASAADGHLLNLMLGFGQTQDTSFGSPLIGQNQYNTARYTTLTLESDIIRDRSWDTAAQAMSPILITIPIGSVPYQSFLYYSPPASLEWLALKNSDLNTMQFRIKDDKNQSIDMNGLPITITLELR